MAESITVPFDDRSAEELQTAVYEYIQLQFPDWVPQAGNLETILVEAITNLIFELFTLAADVPPEHMAYFGKLIKIDRAGSKAATVTTTWTTLSEYHDEAKVIPVDTLVGWGIEGDQIVGFTTVNEVTIPAGSDSTAAGAITIQAVAEGQDGNGFGGNPELITLLDFVDTITTVGTTSGGRDEENLTDYLNKLSTRLTLLADRPIRAEDVSVWVTTVMDNIAMRALCFDNYNGLTDTPDLERCCTIVAHDFDGADLTTPNVNLLLAAIELTREIGFEFYYKHPTRTAIRVKATVVAEEGVDTVALAANVKTALIQALHPTQWGQTISAQGPEWRNDDTVFWGWVYSQIVRVEGVRYIDPSNSLLLSTAAAPTWVATDIALPGLAPLTSLDEVNTVITAIPSPA